jgi:RecA-family ATPase
MEDENDNAKVKMEVIQPLKNLSKRAETGVLLLHHTGKFNEGSPQAEDAYKGRGASAFGALARVVFNLKPVKNSNKVTLSCSKVKFGKFESVVIELDQDTRWFKEVEKSVAQNSKRTHYEQVVNVVKGFNGKKVKRKEIEAALKAKGIEISQTSVTRILGEAVKNDDLLNPSYGYYCSPINPEVEIPLKE